MLAQKQPFHIVNVGVEGIAAGSAHFIRGWAHHAVRLAALRGIFKIYQRYRAGPGAAIRPGQNGQPVTCPDGAALKLTQRTLDPESAGLLNGDEGQGIAVVVGLAVGVDGLDAAGDRGGHLGVFKKLFGLFDLGLLGFQLQLGLLQIHLSGLDFNGVLELGAAADTAQGFFQGIDLQLEAFYGGLKLLCLQPLLVQAQLQLLRIIAEKLLSLLHIVAFLDEQLRYGLIRILFNFGHVFGYDDAGESV